jgi:transposase
MKALQIKLSTYQRTRLQQVQKHSPSVRVGKRACCVLLSAQGAAVRLIQQATGLGRKTITDIRQRFLDRGLASLFDQPRSGRPPRVTRAYRRELREALGKGPLAYGYVFTTWSIARLGEHLRQRTGIAFSRDWLRQLVHACRYRCRRPKHTLRRKRQERGSARAYRQAQKRLEALKKGRLCLRPTMSSGMATKPSFTSIPTWPAAG